MIDELKYLIVESFNVMKRSHLLQTRLSNEFFVGNLLFLLLTFFHYKLYFNILVLKIFLSFKINNLNLKSLKIKK